MIEAITNFFHSIFENNVILATIIIAIVPMIELKGAIPFAMSKTLWGDFALKPFSAFLYSFLGSMIIVPVLALVFMPIYNKIKYKKFFRSIVNFVIGDVKRKSKKTNEQLTDKSEKKKLWYKIVTVVLFTAFPVPLTGVWTGTCLSVFMGLNFWQTVASVFVGNLICGVIVAFVCSISPVVASIMLYVFLALILGALIYKIIVHIIRNRKEKKVNENEQ